MPDGNATSTYDPVAEYRKSYDDPRSDEEIAKKLKDPTNFRKAFPDYDYSAPDADQRISSHMNDYYAKRFASAPGTFQTKKGGPTYNAKTLGINEPKQTGPMPGNVGTELALGALSGFSGMPETRSPLGEIARQAKEQHAELMEHPGHFIYERAKEAANPFHGIGQIYDIGKGLYESGKEMYGGARESLTHEGKDIGGEGLSGPERFAHGTGRLIGQVAQFAAGREAPESIGEKSKLTRFTGEVKPHLVEELGHTRTVGGRLAKMAAEKYLPDTPETIAQRAREAEEAKAGDIDKAIKIQDVHNRRVAREQAAADREAARVERQKTRDLERQGKPVPITQGPNFDIEGYKQGVAARTSEPQSDIGRIERPEAGPAKPAVSEGRPATWTNERVMELARQGNRDAIAQVGRRGLVLPENSRYVAGDVDFPRVVLNPREVTQFTPEGVPISQGGKLIGSIKQPQLKVSGITEEAPEALSKVEPMKPPTEAAPLATTPISENLTDRIQRIAREQQGQPNMGAHTIPRPANVDISPSAWEKMPNARRISEIRRSEMAAERAITPDTQQLPHPEPAQLEPEQSTFDKFYDKEADKWSPEREANHQAIAERAVEGKTPPKDRPPEAIIMLGGTGAGKTTVTRGILGENNNLVNIDSDANKLLVPEYEGLKKTDPNRAAARVHDESKAISKRIIQEAVGKGLDFVYDTSTGGGGAPLFKKLKDLGYNVKLVFADVPVEEAINRARERALSSADPTNHGRFVPEDIIRKKHAEAAKKFLEYQNSPHVDEIRAFDTTARTPQEFYSRTGKEAPKVHNEATLKAVREKAGS